MAEQAEQGLENVFVLKVPYSDFSRYDTTQKLNFLANAPDPGKDTTINPVRRFIISTIGVFFLMVGLIGFAGGQNNLVSLTCIFLALLIIWTFIARPEIQKRRVSLQSKTLENPEISITFAKHSIAMRSPCGELKKGWPELTEYRKTKKGIHLKFADGIEAWIPLDTFYEGELRALIMLLQNRKQT